MNPSEETQEINQHGEKIEMDALLKEYELVELEIDNHHQNMSTMGSLFVTALVILIGFIITDKAYELLLAIPFFLCITSVYLLNQKRTLTFDTFYAKKIEDKINTLIKSDKTIYFEHMSYRMWKATSDMEWTISIASIAIYLGALIYYNPGDASSRTIDILLVLYCLVLACITLWCVICPALNFTKWSEDLEARIKDEDSSISNSDNKKYSVNTFKNRLIDWLVPLCQIS